MLLGQVLHLTNVQELSAPPGGSSVDATTSTVWTLYHIYSVNALPHLQCAAVEAATLPAATASKLSENYRKV